DLAGLAFEHHGGCAGACRGDERFGVGIAEIADEVLEVARVRAVRRPWKTVVTTNEHAHAALSQRREYGVGAFGPVGHPGRAGLLKSDAPRLRIVQEAVQQADGGCDEYAIARGLQQVEAFLVRVFAVIEDVYAVPERKLDRSRGAHVGGDALAVRMCRG